MTSTTTFPLDTPADALRAAELGRVKLQATLVLAGTLALFVAAKVLLHTHPAFGFVAAFAEAATIGGLADWYAVVALFKRPLGLPIPHTAIIPSNQNRIADKLGEFIEVHFLEAAPIEAKLRQFDFGAFVADWLRDRKKSDDLARFALRLLPEAFSATESSGLMTFVTRRITAQLLSVDLAPLAADTLRAFVEEGRHQALLDEGLGVRPDVPREIIELGAHQQIALEALDALGIVLVGREAIDEGQHHTIELAAEGMFGILTDFLKKRAGGGDDLVQEEFVGAVKIEQGRQFGADFLPDHCHGLLGRDRLVDDAQEIIEQRLMPPLLDEGSKCAGRKRREIDG